MKVLLLIGCFFLTSWVMGGGNTGVTPPDDAPFSIQSNDIKSVYDGDTLTLFCPKCEKRKLKIRLLGVDTPEIKGRCSAEIQQAKKARDYLRGLLSNNTNMLVIPNKKRLYDYYGRLLADIKVDGKYVSKLLIESDLGRPYKGGKRASWC